MTNIDMFPKMTDKPTHASCLIKNQLDSDRTEIEKYINYNYTNSLKQFNFY